jgi:hypothetical protein
MRRTILVPRGTRHPSQRLAALRAIRWTALLRQGIWPRDDGCAQSAAGQGRVSTRSLLLLFTSFTGTTIALDHSPSHKTSTEDKTRLFYPVAGNPQCRLCVQKPVIRGRTKSRLKSPLTGPERWGRGSTAQRVLELRECRLECRLNKTVVAAASGKNGGVNHPALPAQQDVDSEIAIAQS